MVVGILLAALVVAPCCSAMASGANSSAAAAYQQQEATQHTVSQPLDTLKQEVLEKVSATITTRSTKLTYFATAAFAGATAIWLTAGDAALPTRAIAEKLSGLFDTLSPVIKALGAIAVGCLGIFAYRRAQAKLDQRIRDEQERRRKEDQEWLDARFAETKKQVDKRAHELQQQTERRITEQFEAERDATARLMQQIANQRLEEIEKELERLQSSQRAEASQVQEILAQTHAELENIRRQLTPLHTSNDVLMKQFVPQVLAKIDAIAGRCESIAREYQLVLAGVPGSASSSVAKEKTGCLGKH